MTNNKHLVVTGATGYLGPEILLALLVDGYKITSISRHDFDLEIAGLQSNQKFDHIVHDINDKAELQEIITRAVREKGKIDGILIMANKGSRQVDLNESEQKFLQNFTQGPITTFVTVTACIEFLNENASIVVFGSIWGTKIPYKGLYLDMPIEPSLSLPASKAALSQLVKSFAAELAILKVRVNLITPGWFPKPGKVERTDYITGITNRTPLGRIGLPKDLIGPVKFLISDSSSFITGQNIIVDGGFSIY